MRSMRGITAVECCGLLRGLPGCDDAKAFMIFQQTHSVTCTKQFSTGGGIMHVLPSILCVQGISASLYGECTFNFAQWRGAHTYVHFDGKVLWRCLTGRQHEFTSGRCGIRVSWAFSRMQCNDASASTSRNEGLYQHCVGSRRHDTCICIPGHQHLALRRRTSSRSLNGKELRYVCS
jgi:ribosomal protein L24E